MPQESASRIRSRLTRPHTGRLSIRFNQEKIKGFYNIIDARSPSEKSMDNDRGELAGPVIAFITGHGQRPADAWKFRNDLALKSKAGIVVVPVCDTPYGKNREWRGDRGKDVVLMAMIRHLVLKKQICLEGVRPLTDLDVKIFGGQPGSKEKVVSNRLAVVGWSHGGLLSRRLASAYPETITQMAQVCPAGYAKWKRGSVSMLTHFVGESLRLSSKLFSGHAPDVIQSGAGVLQGVSGDTVRGLGSALVNAEPDRMLRPIKDIKDASLYCDDANLPLRKIKRIIVIFAKHDTVMTDLEKWRFGLEAKFFNTSVQEREAEMCKTIPLNRIGQPREVGDLVSFLASDASSYITGQAVNITGGQLMEL